MSSWDRAASLEKYSVLFDEAESEEELIAQLGTPTKLAIGLALNYVPSPAPTYVTEEPVAAEEEEDTESSEAPAQEGAEAPADEDGEEGPAKAAELSPETLPEIFEDEPEEQFHKPKVRVIGLIASIILGLAIGVPVAVVLICLGIPFLVTGASVAALAVWGFLTVVGMLTMFSDVLIIAGAGLILVALGLLLAWFGLWLSLSLGHLWIGGVVLRLGRAMSYKKEVAAQ